MIKFCGYQIDAINGVVYGRYGRPIGARGRGGYVLINHGRNKMCRRAHRMIWESVNGPIPEGFQINHINGIKDDNRIENLEMVTPRQNMLHAYRTGLTSAKGCLNGRSIGKRRMLGEKAA